MLPAVRSAPPGGAGERESATAWRGAKRRKTTRQSPDDDVVDMEIELQEGQGSKGLLVYSANDEISDEEFDLCVRKLESRKPTIYVPGALLIYDQKQVEELFERFYQLRMKEYCKIKNLDHTNAPTGSKYPDEIRAWGDPCSPDRMFDWTIDNNLFYIAELSDYQRIFPTRDGDDEYYDWEAYCTTLSNYETDEDYVKYCDSLSKKIKWVEEYKHLDDIEFSKIQDRAFKQAMKIAGKFFHLHFTLAVRGYEEHIWYMRPIKHWKGLDKLHLEIWKRVTKQKMGFTQALKEILAENLFPSWRLSIEAEIKDEMHAVSSQFEICMEHIPKNVEEKDVLGYISYALYELGKPKTYVHYVRKKLEIGRRLQLIPTRSTWTAEIQFSRVLG